jgi:Zn-dependent alcohol dehydrogenase
MASYPAVPGHELAGVVTAVGPEVKDLEVQTYRVIV